MDHAVVVSRLFVDLDGLCRAGLPDAELLGQAVQVIGRAFDWIDVGVLLVDPDDPGQLVLRASNYAGFPDAVGNFRQPAGGGIVGRAFQRGELVRVADVSADPDYLPVPGVPVVAEAAAPIWVAGRVAGVINAESISAITEEAAAALAWAAEMLGDALTASHRRLRVAVAGTGSWAESAHLPGLAALPFVDLAAVYGRRPERAAQLAAQFGVGRSFSDLAEMLRLIQPEVVVITTANHQHEAMAVAALRAGAHVICEKPLAVRARDAQAMLAEAEARHRRHLTFFTYRGMPGPRHLKGLIAGGYLGRLHHVHASYLRDSWLSASRPASWKTLRSEAGSGVLGDLGVHVIDMLQWFFGPVQRAAASLQVHVPLRAGPDGAGARVETDDAAALVLEFSASGQATVQVSRVAAGRRNYQRLELHGSDGILVYEFDPPAGFVGRVWGARGGSRDLEPLPLPAVLALGFDSDQDFPAVYRALTASFFRGVFNPGAPQPEASFAAGLAAQRVVDAALRSAQTGRWEDTACEDDR